MPIAKKHYEVVTLGRVVVTDTALTVAQDNITMSVDEVVINGTEMSDTDKTTHTALISALRDAILAEVVTQQSIAANAIAGTAPKIAYEYRVRARGVVTDTDLTLTQANLTFAIDVIDLNGVEQAISSFGAVAGIEAAVEDLIAAVYSIGA